MLTLKLGFNRDKSYILNGKLTVLNGLYPRLNVLNADFNGVETRLKRRLEIPGRATGIIFFKIGAELV